MPFSGKWHFSFLFPSKTASTPIWNRMLLFHHLRAPIKAAQTEGRNRTFTYLTWNHASKKRGHFLGFHFFFLFSSKMASITIGKIMILLHHMGASTKAAPAIGGIGIGTFRNWNNFPKKGPFFGSSIFCSYFPPKRLL